MYLDTIRSKFDTIQVCKKPRTIDTAEDEHSEKYTRGLILTKKRIVKNVFRVPPVLGSIVKNLEKAMVLSKGCFIGLLKAISGLFR